MTVTASSPPEDPTVTAEDRARAALFHDLTRWREQLSRSVARNNLTIRSESIAAATNRIILSLLFLRIAEDRGCIAGGALQELHEQPDLYGQLLEVTAPLAVVWDLPEETPRQAPVPMGTIVIEDRVIRAIVSRLISPDRNYRFDTLGTEVIADVLARFLTRTIRRSATHHADVVDTHDTVLSCGAAPLPLAAIRYLAESSVHAILATRSGRELLPPRIVDPACGTGTILISAYEALLRGTGPGRLTYEERHAILTGSVHGVDISPHAVAVTKILLFFRLCEGCAGELPLQEFLDRAGSVFHDLRHTIRCGNAVIGPDITGDESWSFCPVRERHLLNLFAWDAEFPEIFGSGRFDAVISSLPEGRPEKKEWIQQYLQRHYAVYDPAAGRSFFFIERGLSLIRPGGILGICSGDHWLRGRPATSLRALLSSRQVDEIVEFQGKDDGEIRDGICLLRVTSQPLSHRPRVALAAPGFSGDIAAYVKAHAFPLDCEALGDGGWALHDTRAEMILRKVSRHSTPLEEYVMGQVYTGIRIDGDDPFVIDEARAREWLRRDQRCKPFVRRIIAGADIGRCRSGQPETFLILIPRGWTLAHPGASEKPWQWFRHRHPLIARYLQPFSAILKARAGPDALWWETASNEFWQDPRKKILFPAQFGQPEFLPDTGRSVGDESVCAIPSAGLYLAGVLSSRLMTFVFNRTVQQHMQDQEIFAWEDLRTLPVYTPDLDRPEDRARHERMEKLVRRLIDLKKNVRHARTDPERESLQQKIRAADALIDTLVYELYGLTTEEISFVESVMPEDSAP
ncbi:MAG: hypothetical protein WCX22_11290 [Methanoregula sp.]